jgi:hypothetical protein
LIASYLPVTHRAETFYLTIDEVKSQTAKGPPTALLTFGLCEMMTAMRIRLAQMDGQQ